MAQAGKVAVVVFPGSNCDRDTYYVLSEVMGLDTNYHWYMDRLNPDYRAVVLPGGFAYGDYLRAGAIARFAPAVRDLEEFIGKGGLVLGICNGFQVLVEAGYLPGALMRNQSLRFHCRDVFCRVENHDSPFFREARRGQVLRLPVAHGEGCYRVDDEDLAELEACARIALRYTGPKGEAEDRFNVNGSVGAIAAVTNRAGNVLGLMPHPERCSDPLLGNTDGLSIFRSMARSLE